MKEWSKSWKSSSKTKKQRKYAAQAPIHVKRKFLGAHLSKELRSKHATRRLPLRSGDKVKIMRGSFKGITGSVDRVDLKRSAVYITGIEITKRDGSKITPPIKASNLLITELNLNDKRRLKKRKKDEKPESSKR